MPEDPKERVDRELIEFLNELRVALPGVQVIFAFLLTIPFTARFAELGPSARRVYVVAVACMAIASVLIIAPAAHHRLRFRTANKEQMLKFGTVTASIGTGFLAVGLGASVYIVGERVYGSDFAAVAAGALVGLTALLWFVVPIFYGPPQRRSP